MTDLKALSTLIGGYLNQDWPEEYSDPWAAVERFVQWEPDYAPHLRADIAWLMTRCASDQDLENVMDKWALGYAATNDGWDSYGAWLLAVADRVDELLHKSPAA